MKTAKKLKTRRGSSKRNLKKQRGGQSSAASTGISIYSGGGTSRGYVNGNISQAKYNEPWGITKDSSGNMYIADKANNCIRKIDTTGNVTTFAGVQDDAANVAAKIRVPVNPGYVNGQGTAARLRRPQGIVCDRNDNLYFVETDNHVIRKISPTGLVTTFAGPPATTANSGGQTTKGFVNGPSATATFNQPFGITIDSVGNLYVADNQNHAIRKIDTNGNVTTFAGGSNGNTDGTGTAAKFKYPYAVVCDLSNNVFVADYMNGAVRKITPAGVVTTIAGGSGLGYLDGVKTAAKLRPVGITLGPDNTLFVTDGDPDKNAPAGTAHRIRMVNTVTGTVTTFAGNGTQTPSTTTAINSSDFLDVTFSNPTSMLHDSVNKKLYVVNTGMMNPPNPNPFFGNYINIMDVKPKIKYVVTTLAGGTMGRNDGSGATAQFNLPNGMSLKRNGNLIVADSGNHRIRQVTPAGVVTTLAGTQFGYSDGVGDAVKLGNPTAVVEAGNGDMYIADMYSYRIRKLTPNGNVSTVAGTGNFDYLDGPNLTAKFRTPYGIVTRSDGSIVVSDAYNHRIRELSAVPGSTVQTVVGNGQPWYGEGTGVNGFVSMPLGMALDKDENVIIADSGNNRIRKLTRAGVLSTVMGVPVQWGETTYPTFNLNKPSGVAVDKDGNIFISDTDNNRIRMITPAGVVSTLIQEDKTEYVSYKPCGLVVDSNANVYVVENEKHRIIKMAPVYYYG